jgi:hypothetical protein
MFAGVQKRASEVNNTRTLSGIIGVNLAMNIHLLLLVTIRKRGKASFN